MNRLRAVAIEEMLRTGYHADAKGCWLWLGAVSKSGYGFIHAMSVDCPQTRIYAVYRLAYEYFKGAIPFGMCVRHECHNRRCWNPKHLLLGTAAQNMQDMIRAGRSGWQRKQARAAKEAAEAEQAPMVSTLAEKVMNNEWQRLKEGISALAKKKAMPELTRADRLMLTPPDEEESA